MEIYDSRYFIYNKRLQMALGIWPYQHRIKNLLICFGLVVLMICMLIPQLRRLESCLGKDITKTMEKVFLLVYIFGIFVKLFTVHYAEDQLKILYESAAKNFEIYTDEVEKKIMNEYSERGRLLTIGFIVYMPVVASVYIIIPLCPIILDAIIPLDHPRMRMSILDGDYFIDEHDYYWIIGLFDITAIILTIFVMCSTDPMYVAIVEHCLGLFSICKYRLQNFNKSYNEIRIDDKFGAEDHYGSKLAYAALVKVVQLHKDIIKYTQIMQASYSLFFLLEMGVTVGLMVSNSVVLVIKQNEPLEFVRWSVSLLGVILHIFYLTWPGQKLIDFSGDIFQDTYHNDWYRSSLKCQNLLRFMALRCSRPCELSGGGLYVMNFINFATIIKTSASYITVFSSV